MSTTQLRFADWKSALREDCVRCGNISAFDALGDTVLQLFWERGVEPTVQGILEDTVMDMPRISPTDTVH